jgi:O-antigen ligase
MGAMINRLDNLWTSVEMFFYNPIGYGLGIAGPASQIGNSIESAGSWQVATASALTVHKFLPENWYVQIALEQGIIGVSLFIALLIYIGFRLISVLRVKRDFLTVGILTAYFALCFMALFTHAFEEAASSYILFFFIGLTLASLRGNKY